ncbi:MAG: transporter substrate-binding domain-containing protein [Pseudomonadaceae bacterium]|nr:transporter substrate-binding domain-containing protein [Pseudomonadaceae bacterium]
MAFLTVIVTLFGLAISPAIGAEQTPLKLVYADYKPYSWEEHGEVVGLEIDILNEALGKRMGLQLSHRVLPWARAQLEVELGHADAFVATLSEQRSEYADASAEALTNWEVALYFKRGDPRFAGITGVSDLAPFNIGSMIGNAWVETNLSGMSVSYARNMEQLPEMLMKGRIDVIPDSPLAMRRFLNEQRYKDKIVELPMPELNKPMFLYLGKNSKFRQRLGEFDTILLQMKKDGSLQRIHDRYLSQGTEKL